MLLLRVLWDFGAWKYACLSCPISVKNCGSQLLKIHGAGDRIYAFSEPGVRRYTAQMLVCHLYLHCRAIQIAHRRGCKRELVKIAALAARKHQSPRRHWKRGIIRYLKLSPAVGISSARGNESGNEVGSG